MSSSVVHCTVKEEEGTGNMSAATWIRGMQNPQVICGVTRKCVGVWRPSMLQVKHETFTLLVMSWQDQRLGMGQLPQHLSESVKNT